MPLTNPSCPTGPYRVVGREYGAINDRTDRDALQAVVPASISNTELRPLNIARDDLYYPCQLADYGDKRARNNQTGPGGSTRRLHHYLQLVLASDYGAETGSTDG